MSDVTADNITDEQIRILRDGVVDDPIHAAMCRVALQHGEPTGRHPFCRVCSWRKGGPDSWDGRACKCGSREPPFHRCDRCAGLGTVPYDVGSQPCPSCDGSGLVHPHEIRAARTRCADAWNARHGDR